MTAIFQQMRHELGTADTARGSAGVLPAKHINALVMDAGLAGLRKQLAREAIGE